MSRLQDSKKSITAQNEFAGPIPVRSGNVDISISGSFVANVRIQRSFEGDVEAEYVTLESFVDVAGERTIAIGSDQLIRVGVPTGDFTSGTPKVRVRHRPR